MLDEFDKKFDQTRQEKAKKLGMTVEEVLIRASLLQKENRTSGGNIRLSQALFRIVLIKDEVTVRFHCCICYYKRPVWNRTSNV